MGIRIGRPIFVGGAFLVGGTIVQAAVGLVASLVLARLVGPEVFGRFAAALAVVGLSFAILSARISVLVTRAHASDLEAGAAGRYATVLVLETVVAGGASLIILLLFGPWDVLIAALVVSQCILHWVNGNKAFFERSMRYRRLAVLETAAVVAGHILGVALAVLDFGAAALFLREMATALFLFAALGAAGALTWLPLRRLSVEDGFDLFKEARSVWLDGIMEASFNRLTILAATSLGSDRLTGYFSMAQSLVMRPHQFVAPVATRLASNWFRSAENAGRRERGLNRISGISALLLSPIALGMAFLAEPLVVTLLGESWRDATPVVWALSGTVLFLTLFEILRGYSLVLHRERDLLISRIAQYAALAATMGAGYVLWPDHAVVSLGLAVSGAFIAAYLTLWLQLARRKP